MPNLSKIRRTSLSNFANNLIIKFGAENLGALLKPWVRKISETSEYHIVWDDNKNLLLFASLLIIASTCISATSSTSTKSIPKFAEKGIDPSNNFLIAKLEPPISLDNERPITTVGFIVQTSILSFSFNESISPTI